MKVKLFAASFLILFITGCVPSLHQLWTDKTLVYDEAIVGSYKEGNNLWKFTGDPSDMSYALVVTDKEDKKSDLSAHLVNVKGQLFLDLYPSDDAEIESGDWLKFHLLRAHLFFRVEKSSNGLIMTAMNPEEVGKLLKEKPALIKHEVIEEDRVVLTDTPENLQKFLIEAPKLNKEVFGEPDELVRITD